MVPGRLSGNHCHMVARQLCALHMCTLNLDLISRRVVFPIPCPHCSLIHDHHDVHAHIWQDLTILKHLPRKSGMEKGVIMTGVFSLRGSLKSQKPLNSRLSGGATGPFLLNLPLRPRPPPNSLPKPDLMILICFRPTSHLKRIGSKSGQNWVQIRSGKGV